MIKKLFILLVVLAAASCFGLQWFLQNGLGPAIQKALPAVKEAVKVDVSIKDVSLNLLAGSLTVDDVKIGNPEGFEEPHLFTLEKTVNDIGLMDLIMKQIISVEEVTVKKSIITAVRNKEGDINVMKLIDGLKGEEEAAPAEEEAPTEEEAAPAEEKAAGPLPPFALNKFRLSSELNYIDHKISDDPFKLGLIVNVNANNISTFGPEQLSGSYSVDGHLAGDQDLFVIKLKGRVAPITDPAKPTFTMQGTVDSVDLKLFSAFSKDMMLDKGTFAFDMNIVCNKGVFDKEKSVVAVLINKMEMKTKMPGGIAPSSLKLELKIGGTIDKPDINFGEAFKEGLKNAFSGKDALKAQLGGQLAAQGIDKENVSKMADEKKKELGSMLEGKAGDKDAAIGGLLGGDKAEGGDKKDAIGGLLGGDKAEGGDKKDAIGGLLGGDKAEGGDKKAAIGGLLGGGKDEGAAEEKSGGIGSMLGGKSEDKAEAKTEEKAGGIGGLLGGAKKDGDKKKSLGSLF